MLFRIMTRNKEKGLAYAERIEAYRLMPDGKRAYVRDTRGGYYFADPADIVRDPVIVRRCSADWLYQILLED